MFFFYPEEIDNGESIFESIKHVNEYGQEFWNARELQTALEYTEWRNFLNIIHANENSGQWSITANTAGEDMLIPDIMSLR